MEDMLFDVLLEGEEENLQLPSPILLQFYKNIKDRVYWIDGEVDKYTMELQKYILQWNKEDIGIPIEQRKPIKIFFFTDGGILDVGITLTSTISGSKTPIQGYNMGKCCSAGVVMFLACHEKYMLSNSYFLIHQGEGGVAGTYAQTQSFMKHYGHTIDTVTDFISSKIECDAEKLKDKIKTEWYLYQDDAVAYKIVDGIIENMEEVFS